MKMCSHSNLITLPSAVALYTIGWVPPFPFSDIIEAKTKGGENRLLLLYACTVQMELEKGSRHGNCRFEKVQIFIFSYIVYRYVILPPWLSIFRSSKKYCISRELVMALVCKQIMNRIMWQVHHMLNPVSAEFNYLTRSETRHHMCIYVGRKPVLMVALTLNLVHVGLERKHFGLSIYYLKTGEYLSTCAELRYAKRN